MSGLVISRLISHYVMTNQYSMTDKPPSEIDNQETRMPKMKRLINRAPLIVNYLIGHGPAESPDLEGISGLSHSSFWKLLEKLVNANFIEVCSERQFKKAGKIKTYRVTSWFFRTLLRTDLDLGEFFPDIRKEAVSLIRGQPSLWPWLGSQIPHLEEVNAPNLLDWLIQIERPAIPDLLLDEERHPSPIVMILWFKVNYPLNDELPDAELEYYEVKDTKRKALKAELDRYLKTQDNLENEIKRGWREILERRIREGESAKRILSTLK
jgi:hypothetical protein